MIPFKELIKLAKALPKCSITHQNESGVSYIVDRQNNKVGDIYWKEGEIAIYEEYEYSEQVIEAIGENKFTDVRKEFKEPDLPVEFNEGEPTLPDRGKLLYEKPREMEKEMVDEFNK